MESSKECRVVLADDHDLIRDGLKLHLNSFPHINIVAEVADGRDLLTAVKENNCNLAVIDLALPGVSGFVAMNQLKKECPEVKVVILTAFGEKKYLKTAKDMGADGFILKDEPSRKVIEIIERIWNGESYFPVLEDEPGVLTAENLPDSSPVEWLTSREMDILRFVSRGRKNVDIANELNISLRTVELYKKKLKTRLKLPSTADLIRYAVENNIV